MSVPPGRWGGGTARPWRMPGGCFIRYCGRAGRNGSRRAKNEPATLANDSRLLGLLRVEDGAERDVMLEGGLRVERPVDLTGDVVGDTVGLHHPAGHLDDERDRDRVHAAEGFGRAVRPG